MSSSFRVFNIFTGIRSDLFALACWTFILHTHTRFRCSILSFHPFTCQTHARCVRLPRESIFVNGRIICLSTVLYSNGRFVCLHVVDILTVFFPHRCRFPENTSDKSSSHFWRDLLCVSFLWKWFSTNYALVRHYIKTLLNTDLCDGGNIVVILASVCVCVWQCVLNDPRTNAWHNRTEQLRFEQCGNKVIPILPELLARVFLLQTS